MEPAVAIAPAPGWYICYRARDDRPSTASGRVLAFPDAYATKAAAENKIRSLSWGKLNSGDYLHAVRCPAE